jgi:GT2 family glycosyltransferase
MSDPRVTVVVVPRERFSCAPRSLESIYRETEGPFELIYVDGRSPSRIQRYLEARARALGFRLIRTERYLSPNEARNLGLREARTDYVLFIDNDVVVSRGWLAKLVECAEETGAAIVGPLTCIGRPERETIHLAGGEVQIVEERRNGALCRSVRERMRLPGRRVSGVRDQLRRSRCTLAEFHCMLVRRSIFNRIGPLDERMLSTREHLDLCLQVAQAGGAIYFEPSSVVTYVPGPPFKLTDLPFYMLRWSDAWELGSLSRFRQKWGLDEDEFFKARYERLGWRRRESLLRPAVRRLTLGRGSYRLEGLAGRAERVLNRHLSARHERARDELR